MPYADSSGQQIYYESHGSGQTVVFIHGGNGNTLSWFQQVPAFAERRHCITVDLRGFKQSVCALEHCHPKHYPADIIAVLDHAGVDRAALVCQSLGAWAGLPLAVRHPERVSALVISSSPTPAYSERNWEVLKRSGSISMAVQRGELPKAEAMGLSRGFMQAQPTLVFLYEALGRLNGPRRTAAMMDAELQLNPPDFEGYTVPTLVTGGVHDTFLTPDHHDHVASLIPGALTHTFRQSGHSAYFEEPIEYNKVLAVFLDRHAPV